MLLTLLTILASIIGSILLAPVLVYFAIKALVLLLVFGLDIESRWIKHRRSTNAR